MSNAVKGVVVTRIFLCDDAVAFSALAGHWAEDCEDLEVVGVAADVDELIEKAPGARPHVIVLDHLLGSSDSSDVAPRVREAVPGAALLLLSGMPPDALAEAAKACGADGYVSKAVDAEGFCSAVRAVAPRDIE